MVLLAEGFGFNTNILETNVLNLAVVVPAVFVLGKDTLTSILETRREKILASLRSADDRFKAAQLELDAAKSELALAAEKVKEIQSEGQKTMEALRLEEEKVIAEFRQQLIKVAFEKALTGIKSRMSPSLHRKYIDAKIALMSSRL